MAYTLEGTVWANRTITYSFTSSDLSQDKAMFDGNAMTAEEQTIVQSAFAKWASVANVQFVQVADSAQSDIRIGLTQDGEDGLELGETTYTPLDNFQPDVRIGLVDPGSASLSDIDGVLTYHLPNEGQATFYQTVLHEIGHAIGLDHDYTNPAAVMSPSISSTTDPDLTSDDIAGAQALYGAAAGLNWTASNGYYNVGSTVGATATITDSNITVYGGASNLQLTGGGNLIVFNGAGQSGALDITATSGTTQVWAGSGAVQEHLAGGSRIETILGSTPGQSTSLTVDGGDASDTVQIDVWGQPGETDTITKTTAAAATVFGGNAETDYTGGNTVLVANGTQTGSLLIHSQGGNTVWAGQGTTTFYESTTGDDTIVQGSGATVIRAAADPAASGTTTVDNLGGTGTLEYDGSAKAASIDVGASQATVFAGSGQQDMYLDGTGSLVAVAATTSTGMQFIHGSGTGHLEYWGGGNAAVIQAGAGTSFVSAGTGNLTITGGTGTLTANIATSMHADLSFSGSAGNAVIDGFDASRDTLSFSAGAVVGTSTSGGSLSVALADGHSVLLQGVADTHGITFS